MLGCGGGRGCLCVLLPVGRLTVLCREAALLELEPCSSAPWHCSASPFSNEDELSGKISSLSSLQGTKLLLPASDEETGRSKEEACGERKREGRGGGERKRVERGSVCLPPPHFYSPLAWRARRWGLKSQATRQNADAWATARVRREIPLPR